MNVVWGIVIVYKTLGKYSNYLKIIIIFEVQNHCVYDAAFADPILNWFGSLLLLLQENCAYLDLLL
jgi:hypothetical protein